MGFYRADGSGLVPHSPATVLLEVMVDPTTPASTRIRAADSVLGRPVAEAKLGYLEPFFFWGCRGFTPRIASAVERRCRRI